MKGIKILFISLYLCINLGVLVSGKSCTGGGKSTLSGCSCDPLCGNDGFTYTDQCFLGTYNKECGKGVKEVSAGPCKGKMKLVPVTECYPGNGACPKSGGKPRIYDPICSNTGITFGNSCEFHYARKNNTNLEFAKCGKC